MRETLFNWLAPYIEGARCLDLFAGTGALCLEALSRGAAEVVMVEHDADVAKQIRANIERLNAEHAAVIHADALQYLSGRPQPFDVVFLDPPFASAERLIPGCADRLNRGWLKSAGLVYVEAPRALRMPPVHDGWQLLKEGAAGQVSYFLARVAA